MENRIDLSIGGVDIVLESRFALEPLPRYLEGRKCVHPFEDFIVSPRPHPQMRIRIEIIRELPRFPATETIFTGHELADKKVNWTLSKSAQGFIYASGSRNRPHSIQVSSDFSRAAAYFLPKDPKFCFGKASAVFVRRHAGNVWSPNEIISDFLQVLMINYLALKQEGFIAHAAGIKIGRRTGVLLMGRSGAGKSTSASLWDRHGKATVINDDRVIIKKNKGSFLLYACPWHGDFSNYKKERLRAVRLKRVFLIRHAQVNSSRRMAAQETFVKMYGAIFPVFWDPGLANNLAGIVADVAAKVPAYDLGLVKGESSINFIEGLC